MFEKQLLPGGRMKPQLLKAKRAETPRLLHPYILTGITSGPAENTYSLKLQAKVA